MRKPFQIACLAGVGFLAVGVYLMAAGNEPRSGAPTDAPAKAPVVVALQAKPEPKDAKESKGKDAAPASKTSGWIGVMLEETKEKGIRVSKVFPGGPAAFAGVRAGDLLVKIGSKSPATAEAASAAIEQLSPTTKTTVSLMRNGKPVELSLIVGNLREFHEHYAREMSRRDPRDPSFTAHHGVSEADMQVELVRRLFEQNQRLESKLDIVLEELRALKADKGKK